jgi:hypothetical protein
MKRAWILLLALAAGCSSLGGSAPGTRQFDAPIARVRPAFVATLAQLGMPINAIENRGASEILKSRKSGQSVEIEFERLGANSTRVRVTGGGDIADQIMRETQKRLGAT